MNMHKSEFGLLTLRRELEEILVMVNANHNGVSARSENGEAARSDHAEDIAIATEPDIALFDDHPETDGCGEPGPREHGHPEVNQQDDRDDLYDDALLVVTEFGHATTSILQMWLSIDYGRAMTIFKQLQADGLISSRGKVRHKAFSLRRLLEQQA